MRIRLIRYIFLQYLFAEFILLYLDKLQWINGWHLLLWPDNGTDTVRGDASNGWLQTGARLTSTSVTAAWGIVRICGILKWLNGFCRRSVRLLPAIAAASLLTSSSITTARHCQHWEIASGGLDYFWTSRSKRREKKVVSGSSLLLRFSAFIQMSQLLRLRCNSQTVNKCAVETKITTIKGENCCKPLWDDFFVENLLVESFYADIKWTIEGDY